MYHLIKHGVMDMEYILIWQLLQDQTTSLHRLSL